MRQWSFERLWQKQVAVIEREWPSLLERARQRCAQAAAEGLTGRVWQAFSSGGASDPGLARDLAAALVREPRSADLHHGLGLALAAQKTGADVVDYFRRAVTFDPSHLMAGLNLAEALAGAGSSPEAVEQAQRTLQSLESAVEREQQQVGRAAGAAAQKEGLEPESETFWDAPHFPPGFDFFRVEWERAAWSNAGQREAAIAAKRTLLRWRLHMLIAELTHDLGHAYEAVLARPDLPPTQALLGSGLLHAGQAAQAIPHLRRAVADSPFDLAAARLLHDALGKTGDEMGQRRLAHQRRLLSGAAGELVPLEPWIAGTPPVGDELASIIILCCNQLAYTRLCLESVLRHTRPPYELVLVDNGSTDGTPAYLEEIRTCPGPVRVVVIRNETNRGFPEGCNQGLSRASGRYLIFLNNDTVVTPGWLDGLVAWALHEWPSVGLVAAVSNYAPVPQLVAAEYSDLSGLDAFAVRRGQQFARKATRSFRVSGMCLLTRREVLERCGGFDERYGLGFFDDDDLCVRVREAGFQLLIALNVYIHHFGSRTFAELGINCQEQLLSNFEQFKAKWGPERAAGYRLPSEVRSPWSVVRSQDPSGPDLSAESTVSPPIPDAIARARPRTTDDGPRTVSLCMIVKNEEANLPACLESAADLFDEVIVVDTGSADRTKEIAAPYGARVFDFPWCDSFAAARNECLRHAIGDWIFWMDADDRLDEENRGKMREVLGRLADENVVYTMKCLCLPDPVTGVATEVDHVRLFRRHPNIRWEYRVHEQILPAVRRLGGVPRWADVVIQHTGYLDPEMRGRKRERDLRLLLLDNAEHPDEPFILFNLGTLYLDMGRPGDALPLLRRSLEQSHPTDSIVRKLHYLIVQCHRQLGQPSEALAACQAGRAYYADDAELLSQEGQLHCELGERPRAEACWQHLLSHREQEHFASVPVGLHGYRTRHNLAVLYLEQGRAAEAEAQWRAALAEQAGFGPGWMGLAELYLAQGRWQELDQTTAHLANGLRLGLEAAILRARAHLARREYAPARSLVSECIAQSPQALWPRLVLSHVLLQAGTDWPGAEQALRDVLALDPNHAQARHNLTLLLQQEGRT